MKKFSTFVGIVCLFLIFGPTTTGCKAKEGCGLEEKYGAPIGKSGDLSTKRGKSNLFDKKKRKKMRQ